ncbi:MAG TPA: hypothetical protein GX529_06885, partial [Firmicutes bacterium]|nr:hypothetical protein [Candidatus Fermentithermobacillaceae bacterium]
MSGKSMMGKNIAGKDMISADMINTNMMKNNKQADEFDRKGTMVTGNRSTRFLGV